MFKSFEEIIEDHRKRNAGLARIVSILLLIALLAWLFIIGFVLIQGSSAEKLDALSQYRLNSRKYVIASMQLFFILWWIMSRLKFRMLRDRAGIMDDLIRNDYQETGMDAPVAYENWDKTESNSILSKKAGRKLLFFLSIMILASTFFFPGSKSMNIILLSGIVIYEVIALLSGEVVRKYFQSVEKNYAQESSDLPSLGGLRSLKRLLTESCIIAGLFFVVVHRILEFKLLDNILFSFIFLGLYTATFIVKDINSYVREVARFADTARMNRTDELAP